MPTATPVPSRPRPRVAQADGRPAPAPIAQVVCVQCQAVCADRRRMGTLYLVRGLAIFLIGCAVVGGWMSPFNASGGTPFAQMQIGQMQCAFFAVLVAGVYKLVKSWIVSGHRCPVCQGTVLIPVASPRGRVLAAETFTSAVS